MRDWTQGGRSVPGLGIVNAVASMTTEQAAKLSAPKPASHACDACGGSGLGNDHAVSDGRCCPLGSECIDCLSCFGAGRISDVMPASDALADAETMVMVLRDMNARGAIGVLDCLSALGTAAANGRYAAAEASTWASASYRAHDAARAAFRAVPGLRG